MRRRAAVVFEFTRPSLEQRVKLLETNLSDANLSHADIAAIAGRLGATDVRPYGYTFSDITQRLIPAIVLAAYPNEKITRELTLRVVSATQPTPPFKSE